MSEVAVDMDGVITVTGEHGTYAGVPQHFLSIALTGYEACQKAGIETPHDTLSNFILRLQEVERAIL